MTAEPDAREPVQPKPAATVVLLRDDGPSREVEVFLVERQRSMGFMGGMHVFPGGKVSVGDTSTALQARIVDREHGARAEPWGHGVDAAAAAARAVAAIRETFEEAGVLLAKDCASADLAAMRERLLAGEDLAALLEHFGLWLELSLLQPLARWITPAREPVRFDTSFYLARLPTGQVAGHEEKESASGLWLSPSRALEASQAGRIRLAPPTARTLETLLFASSVDAAFEAVAARPLPVVLPVMRTVGDQLVILYPGDPEHPEPKRALDGPTRYVFRRDM
ncbi:MAG: NUDIX hydrolase [Polyangiales bacterium]